MKLYFKESLNDDLLDNLRFIDLVRQLHEFTSIHSEEDILDTINYLFETGYFEDNEDPEEGWH